LADLGEAHRLEVWVHRSLLAGLVVSGLMLIVGLTLALLRGQVGPQGQPPPPDSLIRRAARGDGVAWLDLGLISLIATPILRVIVLAVGWGLAGERRFAAVATTVLALLVLGLVLGVR
jgi:uncharacterized membrane protein